jgi:excinuclease ABC subunit A
MRTLEIIGARKHNLKNLTLSLPKGKIIALTGVSGSGKSSLAFDTIFQEGQRLYLESMSMYARQFFKMIENPQVDAIKGMSPTIALDRKPAMASARATVSTITGINPFLRLLFAKIASAHCPICGKEIEPYSHDELLELIISRFSGQSIAIYAPVVNNRKGMQRTILEKYQKRGFLKARIDRETIYLDSLPALSANQTHSIAIHIDTIQVVAERKAQLAEAIALAKFEGHHQVMIMSKGSNDEFFFSETRTCHHCQIGLPEPQSGSFSRNSPMGACPACQGNGFTSDHPICQECYGSGLNQAARSYKIRHHSITDLEQMECSDLLPLINHWSLPKKHSLVLQAILPQIVNRLNTLMALHLGYIALERRLATLSGGEWQRARLVSQLGFGLSGIIYILDEPSVGMHPAEQEQLLNVLKELQQNHNTIIIAEHDQRIISRADYVIDLGPGSGQQGGNILYNGWLNDFVNSAKTATADYLSGRKKITAPIPSAEVKTKQHTNTDFIIISDLTIHNIVSGQLRIPINQFTVISGVSGSGKSSLIRHGLYPIVKNFLNPTHAAPLEASFSQLDITAAIQQIYLVDQQPIGRNSRACPATYLGLMPFIRELFAGLPQSKARGYQPARFSFNAPGGRCESCQGLGEKTIKLNFFSQTKVTCSHCQGKRFNSETLEICYRGFSIADVLNMNAATALELFQSIPMLSVKLKGMVKIGLDYLPLGQSCQTLSGGESQRLKLCRQLHKSHQPHSVYLLDEPSMGLHPADIQKLIDIFYLLLHQGHTVIVIEHNPDIIHACQHLIDLGPGGGKNGGRILYQGPVNGIIKHEQSITGKYITVRNEHDME